MDNQSGSADRADKMRKLPQAVARGPAEVLQPSLRQRAAQENRPDEGNARGDDGEDRYWADLTAECEHCGGPLPDRATARRMYCSKKCRRAALYALERQARAESRKGRICPECGGPVPDHMQASAIYCSSKCEKRSSLARYRRKFPAKMCPVCLTAFHPYPEKQVCCSYACRDEYAKRRKE